jgi:hypothetical protein
MKKIKCPNCGKEHTYEYVLFSIDCSCGWDYRANGGWFSPKQREEYKRKMKLN